MALERAAEPLIRKTPGVCGGDACIRRMRLPVWMLVQLRGFGLTDQDILQRYPDLTAADLDAAWEYERRHSAEIAKAIKEDEEA
jgi:uncharacterized protein (DUF433 family)